MKKYRVNLPGLLRKIQYHFINLLRKYIGKRLATYRAKTII